jgi:hypothetical protein
MDFSDASAEAFVGKAQVVRQAAGERLPQLEIAMLVHLVTVSDSVSDLDRTRQQGVARFHVEESEVSQVPVALVGSVAEAVDELWRRRELYGLTYVSVLAHNLDSFAPVVRELAGRS